MDLWMVSLSVCLVTSYGYGNLCLKAVRQAYMLYVLPRQVQTYR